MNYVADYNDRLIAFDSNILTYFLDANRGHYCLTPGDPLEQQRIAAMRLFLYCRPVIVPTVKAERTASETKHGFRNTYETGIQPFLSVIFDRLR